MPDSCPRSVRHAPMAGSAIVIIRLICQSICKKQGGITWPSIGPGMINTKITSCDQQKNFSSTGTGSWKVLTGTTWAVIVREIFRIRSRRRRSCNRIHRSKVTFPLSNFKTKDVGNGDMGYGQELDLEPTGIKREHQSLPHSIKLAPNLTDLKQKEMDKYITNYNKQLGHIDK
jgi:hypothetical protein